jgi:tetratricopeptide (TPR) repeat protein
LLTDLHRHNQPKKFFLFVLAIIGMCSFGQSTHLTRSIDSLHAGLGKSNTDTIRIGYLLQLSYTYSDLNSDSALYYAKEAELLATKANWLRGIGNANVAMGLSYASSHDFAAAIERYARAAKYYEKIKDNKSLSAVYANQSLLHKTKGDDAGALKLAFKALAILEDLKDTVTTPIVLENIGTMYLRQKNYAKTLAYYSQAYDLYKRTGNKAGQARNLGNHGIVLNEKGEYAKALQYHLLAYKMNKSSGNLAGQQINLANLGITYLNLRKYEKALHNYELALDLSRRLNDRNNIAINLGNIGELYFTMGQENNPGKSSPHVKKAISNLEEATAMCKETGFMGPYLEFQKYLSDAYSLEGNHKLALETFKDYAKVRDSLDTQDSRLEIAALEHQRAVDLKDRDLKLKDQQLKIERLQVIRKKNERLILGLFILILVIAILLLYRLFRMRIIRHRKVLSDIATIQSHEVRAPLATILGLVSLIDQAELSEENRKVVGYLQKSSRELDDVIRKTVQATYDKEI